MPSLQKIMELVLHPDEMRAAISYKIWRDPLRTLEDDVEGSGWDRESMKTCWDFLDKCSRSFSGVIKELEGELGRVVCIFYLALRALDTIEDDMTLELETKEKLLNELYLKLNQPGWHFDGSGPNEADRFVLVNFATVQEEYARLEQGYRVIIADITRMMGKGMAQYARIAAQSPSDYAVDTLPSLDLYCHYVAGTVGEGLSRLFSNSGKEFEGLADLLELSNSMGLMLQKTNVMRDFREDLDEGRLFWPKEIWGKYVSKPQELYAEPRTREARAEQEKKEIWCLNEMCLDALQHSIDSLDYLSLLKNQSVFNFCAIPQVMAIATLAECWGNRAVFRRNIKIRRGMTAQLFLQATNPREAAHIFKRFALEIQKKTRLDDPSYLQVCVMVGRICQWQETRYPSFVALPGTQPNLSDVRIKALPEAQAQRDRETAALARTPGAGGENKPTMTKEDIKFLALMLLGTLTIILFFSAIVGGSFYYLFMREGAPFHHMTKSEEELAELAAASAKIEL